MSTISIQKANKNVFICNKNYQCFRIWEQKKVEDVAMSMGRTYNSWYSTDGMINVSIMWKVSCTCEGQ